MNPVCPGCNKPFVIEGNECKCEACVITVPYAPAEKPLVSLAQFDKCPFCGSQPTPFYTSEEGDVAIECSGDVFLDPDDPEGTPSGECDCFMVADNIEELLVQWNRRPLLSGIGEVVPS